MKAISELPARGVPMLPAVGACRHSRQGSLLQIPSSGGKLGSEGRSSGGCRFTTSARAVIVWATVFTIARERKCKPPEPLDGRRVGAE
jgi:hypothetical protein